MGEEEQCLIVEPYMKQNMQMAKEMDKENTQMQVVTPTKESGKIIIDMEQEYTNGVMEMFTLVNM